MAKIQQRAITEQLCALINIEPLKDFEIQREKRNQREANKQKLRTIREEKVKHERRSESPELEPKKEEKHEENVKANFKLCK